MNGAPPSGVAVEEQGDAIGDSGVQQVRDQRHHAQGQKIRDEDDPRPRVQEA